MGTGACKTIATTRRYGSTQVLGGLLATPVKMAFAALPVRAQDENADPGAPQLIPAPVSMETTDEVYSFEAKSKVTVDPGRSSKRALPVARWVASFLRTATGYPVRVARQGWGNQDRSSGSGPRNVHLSLSGDGDLLGKEGYNLKVFDHGVLLRAATAEGPLQG